MNHGKSVSSHRKRSLAEVSSHLKPDTINHNDPILTMKKTYFHDEHLSKGINSMFPPQYQIALHNSNDKFSNIIMNHRLHHLKNLTSVINVFDGSTNTVPIDQKNFQQYHITGRQIPVHIPRNKVPRIHNSEYVKAADMNLTSLNTLKHKASL